MPTAWRTLSETAAGGPWALASLPGHQLVYSVGWDLGGRERTAITAVPADAWQIAIDHRGEVRERRADDGCADRCCAHPRCCVQEAHVTELTALLREGPGGDQLAGWPAPMRVFARRERPHPGAQLTLFEAADGWRYSLQVSNAPASRATVIPRPSNHGPFSGSTAAPGQPSILVNHQARRCRLTAVTRDFPQTAR